MAFCGIKDTFVNQFYQQAIHFKKECKFNLNDSTTVFGLHEKQVVIPAVTINEWNGDLKLADSYEANPKDEAIKKKYLARVEELKCKENEKIVKLYVSFLIFKTCRAPPLSVVPIPLDFDCTKCRRFGGDKIVKCDKEWYDNLDDELKAKHHPVLLSEMINFNLVYPILLVDLSKEVPEWSKFFHSIVTDFGMMNDVTKFPRLKWEIDVAMKKSSFVESESLKRLSTLWFDIRRYGEKKEKEEKHFRKHQDKAEAISEENKKQLLTLKSKKHNIMKEMNFEFLTFKTEIGFFSHDWLESHKRTGIESLKLQQMPTYQKEMEEEMKFSIPKWLFATKYKLLTVKYDNSMNFESSSLSGDELSIDDLKAMSLKEMRESPAYSDYMDQYYKVCRKLCKSTLKLETMKSIKVKTLPLNIEDPREEVKEEEEDITEKLTKANKAFVAL